MTNKSVLGLVCILCVWGLQCDAFSTFSVHRLVSLRRSPHLLSSPVLLGSLSDSADNYKQCVLDKSKLSRVELQGLAKKNNIKANSKSSDIIAALCNLSINDNKPVIETEKPRKLIQYNENDKSIFDKEDDDLDEFDPFESDEDVDGVYDADLDVKHSFKDVDEEEMEEIKHALNRQGITLADLEETQRTYADLRPNRNPVKRGKKPKTVPSTPPDSTQIPDFTGTETPTEEATANLSKPRPAIAPVQHLGQTFSWRDIAVPGAMRLREDNRDSDRESNFYFDRRRDDQYGNQGEGHSSRDRGRDRYGDRFPEDESDEFDEYSGRIHDGTQQGRSMGRRYERPRSSNRDSELYDDFDSRAPAPSPHPSHTTSHTTSHTAKEGMLNTHTTRSVFTKPAPRISLEGTTLKKMLEYLVAKPSVGYEGLHASTNLRCFIDRPSLVSSLKVLRQENTAWARKKVELLYVAEKRRESSAESDASAAV